MEGTVLVAAQCIVTVDGFVKSGQEVALASFTFTPSLDPVSRVTMIHAVLPNTFNVPLNNATMTQTRTITSFWIDNLVYNAIKSISGNSWTDIRQDQEA